MRCCLLHLAWELVGGGAAFGVIFLEERERGPGAWWGWRKKGEDREGEGLKVRVQGLG